MKAMEIYLPVGLHEGTHKCRSPQFQHGLKRVVTSGMRAGLEQELAEAASRFLPRSAATVRKAVAEKLFTSLL